MKRLVPILIGLVVLGVVAAFFASPFWAVRTLVQAARDGDVQAIERHVDFPALRESLKDELAREVDAAVRERLGDDQGGLGRLGALIAPALADRAVEALVTPQGVAAMVRTARAPTPADPLGGPATPDDPSDDIQQRYAYRDVNTFVVILTDPDRPDRGLDLTLRRHGLFGWRLTTAELRRA